MNSVKMAAALVLAAALVAAAGCGGRDYGWEEGPAREKAPSDPGSAGTLDAKRAAEAAELEKKALASWEGRDQLPALKDTIAALERLLEVKGGSDYATLVWLSRAYYLMGEVLEEKEEKLKAYEAGMKYGDRALHTIPEFRARFEKKGSVEEAVEAVGKDGIEAVYWDAVNIGKWARLKGISKILFMKGKVKEMVERVMALDETWFFGAAHRYLGAYYAALPAFAGRDLEKSRHHFERAKEIEPKYFTTRVLVAEYLARNLNDRKLYKSELELVIDSPPEVLPTVIPEQRIEQAKARKMLEEIDDHFDPEEGS